MRTDDLIDALTADLAPRRSLAALAAPALALGVAGAIALFLIFFGPRADIASAVETVRFLAKPLLGLALVAAALGLCLRLARPGAATGEWTLALLAVPAAASLLAGLELAALPATAWAGAWIGENAIACLLSIPALAAPVLVSLIAVLRRGAPVRPRLAGAVAGLAAAGVGASLYALHCTDDSPLFVATWYTLAAGVVAGAGALAGRRWLRW